MKTKPFLLVIILSVFTVTACVPIDTPPQVIVVVTATPDPGLLAPSLTVSFVDTNRNVWLWKDDASLVPLVMTGTASDVQISTDGKVIAYLTTSGELRAVDSDGNNDRALVDRVYLNSLIPFGGSTANVYQFRFIPDTHDLFFAVFVAGEVSGVDLFKVNADLLLRERVFAPGQGGNGNYFSPNGEWVVVAYPNQIILGDVNGVNSRPIFNLPPMRGFSTHRGPEVVWADDSSGFYIVVPQYNQDDGNYIGRQSLFFVPLEGDNQELAFFVGQPFTESHISQDGQRVAFLVDDGDLVNLHIVTVGGNDVVYASDNGIGFFGWNPNSDQFVIWQRGEINKPLLGTVDTMLSPLTGDPNQAVDSFEWVEANCFLFTSGYILNLRYLFPADPTNNPNVLVAQNVEPGRYDFTGICARP